MSGTLLAQTEPVARKAHVCQDCQGVIPAGMVYVSQRVAWDGSVHVWKAHPLCMSLFWHSGEDGEDWFTESALEALAWWWQCFTRWANR